MKGSRTMHYRTMKKAGISLSEIGYGGWGIGGWGKRDDQAALSALKRAIDLGVTFFDSALGYGGGHSEELIGRAVKNVRDKVLVASKIPPKTKRWPVLPHESIKDTFPADWVVQCTEESLKHFKLDCIDIQQLHAWTPAYVKQLDWREGLERLRKQGKIRFFGVSANDWDPYGPTTLAESGLIDSIQVIFNIFEQRPMERLLPVAQGNGVGIIVRVPFEEGLLTGQLGPDHRFEKGDWRENWATPERRAEAERRVEKLKPFLAPDRPTLAALALKFILFHPAVTTVIPGMRSVAHVEENVAVSDGKLLPPQEFESLKAHSFVHGWSYPWAQQA
jgi:aryl-alcohol dehydrogenase-like predicted oxidoreductase